MVDYALAYHQLGFSVIPIAAKTKRSAVPWKRYQTKRPQPSTIRKWFGKGIPRNLAIVCGPVSSGLCVRDFDAEGSYERWATQNPSLAAGVPTVTTGRGHHLYFVADPPFERTKHLDDGELRGGGYVLAPPSVHPNGTEYEWQIPIDGQLPILDPTVFASVTQEHTGVPKGTQGNPGELRGTQAISERCRWGDTVVSDAIEQAIQQTLPTGPGKRHRQVFELARALRAIRPLVEADPGDLEPIIRRWHKRALPHIRTQPFEETYIDFLRAWPNVKIPKGATMAEILKAAQNNPLPRAAEEFEQPGLKLLVCICRQLQRHHGREPFFLGCREAGKLLGVDHMTANRWLLLLRARKVIRRVQKGDLQTRKATCYEYLGD